MATSTSNMDPEVLKEIKHIHSIWKGMANKLQAVLIFMGVVSVASSLFITAFAGTLGENDVIIIRIFAFVATLFLTLIGAFNLPAKANNARNAWRHLNKALFQFNSGIIDAGELIKAYEEGENILGSVDFNYKKS